MMEGGRAATLLAQLDESRTEGNQLYKQKNWAGAAAAYTAGLKLAPYLDDENAPADVRQACSVVFTNRSAARFALKQ